MEEQSFEKEGVEELVESLAIMTGMGVSRGGGHIVNAGGGVAGRGHGGHHSSM